MAGKPSCFMALWTPEKWKDQCFHFHTVPHNAVVHVSGLEHVFSLIPVSLVTYEMECWAAFLSAVKLS